MNVQKQPDGEDRMIVDDYYHSNISNLKSNLTDGGGDSNAKKKKRINPTIIN